MHMSFRRCFYPTSTVRGHNIRALVILMQYSGRSLIAPVAPAAPELVCRGGTMTRDPTAAAATERQMNLSV